MCYGKPKHEFIAKTLHVLTRTNIKMGTKTRKMKKEKKSDNIWNKHTTLLLLKKSLWIFMQDAMPCIRPDAFRQTFPETVIFFVYFKVLKLVLLWEYRFRHRHHTRFPNMSFTPGTCILSIWRTIVGVILLWIHVQGPIYATDNMGGLINTDEILLTCCHTTISQACRCERMDHGKI